jgi:U3 small nucleolar RNA-associated protein 18
MSSTHRPRSKQNGSHKSRDSEAELALNAKKRQELESSKMQVESDLEASEDSDASQKALLEEIIPSKAKRAVKSRVIPVDEREKDIEKLLFGSSSFLDADQSESPNMSEDEDHMDDVESDDDEETQAELHVLGLKAANAEKKLKEEQEPAKKRSKMSETEFVAAWEDSDDEDERVNIVRSARSRKLRRTEGEEVVTGSIYQQRLREQHAKISSSNAPNWAQLPDDTEDHTLDVLKSTSRLVSSGNGSEIAPDRIRIGQMADANKSGVSKSVVQVVKWHPNGSLLMTAGFDKTLRLFDIDGLKNAKLQTAHFGDLAISSAEFSPNGAEVYLCGLHHSFYVYDIISAKIDRIDRLFGAKEEKFKSILCSPDGSILALLGGKGHIHIVSNTTKQWIKTLKMNGVINTAVFSIDGKQLWTAGKRGEIFVWSMETFACLRRFMDEGNGSIRSVAMAPSGEYFATGQESGVVNIYRIAGELNEEGKNPFYETASPKPVKSIMNLTTVITSLSFNHDSQILAIASDVLRNKIKLVHIPTFRVYQNWPTEQTNLGRISSLAFSPEGNWLALGNIRGTVKLFKLHHYHPSSQK